MTELGVLNPEDGYVPQAAASVHGERRFIDGFTLGMQIAKQQATRTYDKDDPESALFAPAQAMLLLRKPITSENTIAETEKQLMRLIREEKKRLAAEQQAR